MSLTYHLLDVFTDRVFGGNPLAVFPEAPPLDDATMQRIAAELNLSETVFVYPAERPDSDARLRIFTPRMELPFAGHPTVGTSIVLAELGLVPALRPGGQPGLLRLHENAGVVRVVVERRPAGIYAELQVPQAPRLESAPLARAVLADLIGLMPSDLAPPPHDPCTASAGVPFLIIPLASTSALERAQLDASLWKAHVADAWAPHVYVLHHEHARIRARMFAPAMGITEDPATGAAAAALPAYLTRHLSTAPGTHKWTIFQGAEINRPSQLDLRFEVTETGIGDVFVGGYAARVGEGRLYE